MPEDHRLIPFFGTAEERKKKRENAARKAWEFHQPDYMNRPRNHIEAAMWVQKMIPTINALIRKAFPNMEIDEAIKAANIEYKESIARAKNETYLHEIKKLKRSDAERIRVFKEIAKIAKKAFVPLVDGVIKEWEIISIPIYQDEVIQYDLTDLLYRHWGIKYSEDENITKKELISKWLGWREMVDVTPRGVPYSGKPIAFWVEFRLR